MKKVSFIILLLCISIISLHAQGSYEQGMQKALADLGSGKHQEAIALFERISKAEAERWVPDYYLANTLIVASFATENATEKEAILEKAKASIESAHKKSPDNSEIHTLEGFLYTAYVVMDPMNNSMKYEPKIIALHQKAIELNPDNPRAHVNLIEYKMGKAQFFGQDLAPYCEELKALIPKFENQKLETPFAPSFGLERVQAVVKTCE